MPDIETTMPDIETTMRELPAIERAVLDLITREPGMTNPEIQVALGWGPDEVSDRRAANATNRLMQKGLIFSWPTGDSAHHVAYYPGQRDEPEGPDVSIDTIGRDGTKRRQLIDAIVRYPDQTHRFYAELLGELQGRTSTAIGRLIRERIIAKFPTDRHLKSPRVRPSRYIAWYVADLKRRDAEAARGAAKRVQPPGGVQLSLLDRPAPAPSREVATLFLTRNQERDVQSFTVDGHTFHCHLMAHPDGEPAFSVKIRLAEWDQPC